MTIKLIDKLKPSFNGDLIDEEDINFPNLGSESTLIFWNGESFRDSLTTDEIEIKSIGVQEIVLTGESPSTTNFLYNAGCVTHPVLTDNEDGTATIASTDVALYTSSDSTGTLKKYTLAGVTLTFVDGEEEYVVADYNSGSPIMRKETDKTLINCSNLCSMIICWRQGTTIHSVNQDSSALGLASKTHRALYNTEPYKRSIDGGLSLSETSTPTERTLALTSAVVYAGALSFDIEAVNSSSDALMESTSINGVWSYSEKTVYDNTYYNSTTGLVEATNNYYLIRWIYRSIGDCLQMFYTLGEDEYKRLSDAEDAGLPSISILLRDHCMLVGRVIIKKGESSGIVESAFDNIFSGSLAVSHNDTTSIQGGAIDEYYHLTEAQWDEAIQYIHDDYYMDVYSMSDFPDAVDSVITLEDDFTYVIHGSVSLGINRILTGSNSKIVGNNINIGDLSYTGTGNMITVVDNSFTARTIKFTAVNGTLFDASDSVGTYNFNLLEVVLYQTLSLGTLSGFNRVYFDVMKSLSFNEGFTFTGNCTTVIMLGLIIDTDRYSGTTSTYFTNFDANFELLGSITISNSIFTTYRATDYLLDSEAGVDIEEGLVTNNTFILFTDSSVFNTATPNNFPGVLVSNNLGLEDWKNFGYLTLTGNTTAIATTEDVWYLPTVATTLQISSRVTSPSTGRLMYNGLRTTTGQIKANLTLEKLTSGTVTFEIGLFKNGTLIDYSVMGGTVRTVGETTAISTDISLEIETADYFEIQVRNVSNNDNIIITNLQMQLRA